QEAKAGQIIVTPRVHDVIKDWFRSEALQVLIRGSSRPITGYSVLSAPAFDDTPPHTTTEVSGPAALSSGPSAEQRLGPFPILGRLGSGGMGTVCKARDLNLQRTVALKVLLAELATDEKLVHRFKREARALASLNSPYVAQIYFISEGESP